MKNFMRIGLLSLALAGFAFTGSAADQKIAVFNLAKAFKAYYKTKLSDVGLQQEVSDIEKERAQYVENGRRHEDEWRALIDKANDQAISADEREKSKTAAAQKYAELETDKQTITEFDRRAKSRLDEKRTMRRDDIVKEILGVLNAQAKAAGYTMVLDSSGESANMTPVVLYTNGQDDLTDAIIKELNAAAPPGSLTDPTNTPSATAPPVTAPNRPGLIK